MKRLRTAYEMGFSVVGYPMTDALLCEECLPRVGGAGKRVRMSGAGIARYCDHCGMWLGQQKKEES